jgi:hypothetical protein
VSKNTAPEKYCARSTAIYRVKVSEIGQKMERPEVYTSNSVLNSNICMRTMFLKDKES